jgi:L-threonylcarbamoyladenylate synthase
VQPWPIAFGRAISRIGTLNPLRLRVYFGLKTGYPFQRQVRALETRCLEANASNLKEAALVLRQGGLVAFPTETVYGLGADATNQEAVAKIYQAKQRPSFNPLIAHVESLAEARRQAIFSTTAEALAGAFWPGPLTLVLPLSEGGNICALARAGQPSIALRVPAHPIALALIAATGQPLAAPSANRSGRISPVDSSDVLADLNGSIDLVLQGGPCRIGVESTILSCLDNEPYLLRPGGIAREAIEDILGHPLRQPVLAAAKADRLLASGMLASHYAPRAPLRLEALSLEAGEAGLDFNGVFQTKNGLDLSPTGDLAEAATRLFAYLRRLDQQNPRCIAVAPIPNHGLGEAINDRIRRAAAPRG